MKTKGYVKLGNLYYKETLSDVLITVQHIYKVDEEHDEIGSQEYEGVEVFNFLASDITNVTQYNDKSVSWFNDHEKCIPTLDSTFGNHYILLCSHSTLVKVWEIYLNKFTINN